MKDKTYLTFRLLHIFSVLLALVIGITTALTQNYLKISYSYLGLFMTYFFVIMFIGISFVLVNKENGNGGNDE